MSEIWAGPFFGEFGWETTIWSPWLRYEQDRLKVPFHVVCEQGKALLYEDFATVHEVKVFGDVRRDCQNAFTARGAKLSREDYENTCMAQAGFGVKCITPIDLPTAWPGGTPKAKQAVFKSYRDSCEESRNLIAIHARLAQHAERNWDEAKWDELVDKLKFDCYHVISIGSKELAHHIDGTDDWRGVPLANLSRILSNCDALVGPSSGPLAFAMLCEVPVIWWSQNRKDVARFIGSWNPHKVDTHRVTESWDPTVGEVLRVCRRFS